MTLEDLEHRATEKWAVAAAARVPEDAFDLSQWSDLPVGPSSLPPDTPQFPREQWASYPAKRTVALLTCDRMLDFAADLTDEQWLTLCFLMMYGGKTRLS